MQAPQERFDREHARRVHLQLAIAAINDVGLRGCAGAEGIETLLEVAAEFAGGLDFDGHDVAAIDEAYAEAVETKGQPTVIIAKTLKGKGVSEVEDTELHGKPVKTDALAGVYSNADFEVDITAANGEASSIPAMMGCGANRRAISGITLSGMPPCVLRNSVG